jgi:hypothetical protein
MLACRICRIPIASQEGCGVCKDFKAQLISVDVDEDESPSLADVSAEVVGALRVIVKKGRQLLDKGVANKDVKSFAYGTDMIIKAANTSAKVLEAARKLQTDGLAAIRNMSFIERADLYIGWYVALPPPYRQKVRLGMENIEKEESKPLALTEGTL